MHLTVQIIHLLMSDLSSTFPFSEKITNILDVTLYEAREKSGLTVLDETVRQTMAQMMEVREAILQRIKCLRNGASNDSLRRFHNYKESPYFWL